MASVLHRMPPTPRAFATYLSMHIFGQSQLCIATEPLTCTDATDVHCASPPAVETRSTSAKLKRDEIPIDLEDNEVVEWDDAPVSEDDWDDEPILPGGDEGTLDSVSGRRGWPGACDETAVAGLCTAGVAGTGLLFRGRLLAAKQKLLRWKWAQRALTAYPHAGVQCKVYAHAAERHLHSEANSQRRLLFRLCRSPRTTFPLLTTRKTRTTGRAADRPTATTTWSWCLTVASCTC